MIMDSGKVHVTACLSVHTPSLSPQEISPVLSTPTEGPGAYI